MQGSLFPRWPIHSPRDLGACMPRTYQRLLHDRSCYVSKCRVCIVFPFFPPSSSTVRMHVHTLQLLTSIYSHASNRAWYRLPRTLHFNLLKCWLLYPRFLSVRVTSRVQQKFKEWIVLNSCLVKRGIFLVDNIIYVTRRILFQSILLSVYLSSICRND